MTKLHDALHAMPVWLQVIGIVVLAIGTQADASHVRVAIAKTMGRRAESNPIDNVASWLCLFLLLFLVVSYYWPAN